MRPASPGIDWAEWFKIPVIYLTALPFWLDFEGSRIALAACPEATAFVVAGGVAANGAIRAALTDLASRFDKPFVAPPLWLCTDNGAMIAWAGAERFAAGLTDPLDTAARPRWPLDPDAEKVRGAGVKA